MPRAAWWAKAEDLPPGQRPRLGQGNAAIAELLTNEITVVGTTL
jgi:hypothetical protein